MTTSELAVINAVQGVTATAASMMNTYKIVKSVRKQQSAELARRVKLAQKECIARGAGELMSVNLAEMARIQREIDRYEFNPAFQGLAMQQVCVLADLLTANLEDYMRCCK